MTKSTFLAASLLVLTACGADAGSSTAPVSTAVSRVTRDPSPAVPAEDAAALRAGNTGFALDLLRGLEAGAPGQNVFFSPYSITLASAMTYAGARGSTADEMAKALRFTLPAAKLHPALDALDLALASRGSVSIADAVWASPRTPLEQPFLDTLAASYGAGVQLVDFAQSEPARQGINQWVSNRTHERIQNLLPQGAIDASTALVLVNAIYFKDDWQVPFEPARTHPGTFQAKGGAVGAQLMTSSGAQFPYAKGDGYEAVALPYKSGLSLVGILATDLPAFEASLDAAKLQSITSALAYTAVDVTLPKVKIEGATVSLKNALEALGMTSAFSATAADFSGMSTGERLHLDDAYHQAFVAIDEKGTEAAAATADVVAGTSALVQPPPHVVFDRPFLFAIRDDATGAVLFLGHLETPAN